MIRNAITRLVAAFVALGSLVLSLVAQDRVAVPDAEPQPPERPFFWRIEGDVPSYLFGTIHLPDERVTTLHPEVESAIDRCDALYTELAMDLKLLSAATKGMMLPRGKSLRTVLPEPLYAKLEAFFAERKMPLGAMERMKPWVIATQVAMIDHLADLAKGKPLDLQLYQRAQDDDKEVGGLETMDEQMGIFDSLSEAEQAEVLRKAIDQVERYRREGRDLYEELIACYLSGEGERLEALMNESNEDGDLELNRRIEKALLDDRNRRMAERIVAKLRAEPKRSFFFAVGAAHYFGELGLVDLLRDAGLQITRVPESLTELRQELELLRRELRTLQERVDALQKDVGPQKKAG